MQRGITYALLASAIVVGAFVNVLSIWMKFCVNLELPEDQQLSWWSRNYRQASRLYSERHPDSILPDLNRYGFYLVLVLGAALIFMRIIR